jgi:hypothetical protein
VALGPPPWAPSGVGPSWGRWGGLGRPRFVDVVAAHTRGVDDARRGAAIRRAARDWACFWEADSTSTRWPGRRPRRRRHYVGLNPSNWSSGLTTQPSRAITKEGPEELRLALYQAANVARSLDPQLADTYRRLMVERGHCHTKATCALARKLVARIWATLTTGPSPTSCETSRQAHHAPAGQGAHQLPGRARGRAPPSTRSLHGQQPGARPRPESRHRARSFTAAREETPTMDDGTGRRLPGVGGERDARWGRRRYRDDSNDDGLRDVLNPS